MAGRGCGGDAICAAVQHCSCGAPCPAAPAGSVKDGRQRHSSSSVGGPQSTSIMARCQWTLFRLRARRCLSWTRLLLLPAVVVLHSRGHTLSFGRPQVGGQQRQLLCTVTAGRRDRDGHGDAGHAGDRDGAQRSLTFPTDSTSMGGHTAVMQHAWLRQCIGWCRIVENKMVPQLAGNVAGQWPRCRRSSAGLPVTAASECAAVKRRVGAPEQCKGGITHTAIHTNCASGFRARARTHNQCSLTRTFSPVAAASGLRLAGVNLKLESTLSLHWHL
jgi:hypothetical protein